MIALLVPLLALAAAPWGGDELPLPLSVRSPDDLKFKAAAEKQYLIFNLLAAGKLAWDTGDFPTAAARWEALLRVPVLPPELDQLVRPLASSAREKAGTAAPFAPPPAEPAASPAAAPARPTSVTGTISGGGKLGPGGSVIFLKRADGPTPKVKAGKVRAVVQKDKRFIPRVLVVTQGSTVDFTNEDPLFHNVFSLTRPNDFDLGLYKGGTTKSQTFSSPGGVQLLCNIHSSMVGWIYVVDTPYFAQADVSGQFTIKGVPPGEYLLSVWHESASRLLERKVRVADGAAPLSLVIDADKSAPAFVPDKAGKPRQPQLGY